MEPQKLDKTDFLQFVKEHYAFITSVLLVMGALQVVCYYGYFQFGVISYIEISEILPLTIPNFIALSFIAITYITVEFFRKNTSSPERYISYYKRLHEEKNSLTTKIVLHIKYSYLLRFALLLGIICLISTLWETENNIIYWLSQLLFAITILRFLLFLIAIDIFQLIELPIDENHRTRIIYKQFVNGANILTLFLFLLFISAAIPLTNAYFTDKYANTRLSFIREDGKPITTNDSILYIGKTRDYVFLYNQKNKSTTVYKMDNIKSLTIGHKENHYSFKEALLAPFKKKEKTTILAPRKPKKAISQATSDTTTIQPPTP